MFMLRSTGGPDGSGRAAIIGADERPPHRDRPRRHDPNAGRAPRCVAHDVVERQLCDPERCPLDIAGRLPTEAEAKAYVAEMVKAKRYQRDVY